MSEIQVHTVCSVLYDPDSSGEPQGKCKKSLILNPFLPSELFYSHQMDKTICQIRCEWFSLLL